jgi:hypothetical protein
MTEVAARSSRSNPEPPDEDEHEERPALQLTRRNVLASPVPAASLAALYFLLPQLAGLDDTWRGSRTAGPSWICSRLLLTVGMFGGYVAMFRGVFAARGARASAGARATRSRWPGSRRRGSSRPAVPAGSC